MMEIPTVFIVCFFVLFTTIVIPADAKYQILYLSDYSKQYDVTLKMTTGAGILYSQKYTYYRNYAMDALTITTDHYKRIMINFERLAVETNPYGGCNDKIIIVDGPGRNVGDVLTPSYGLCGSKLPRRYYSSGNSIYIEFTSDGFYKYTGFKLVFTSFVECNANCTNAGMFQCDNHFYIDEDLVEDDHNNCGDNSDEDEITTGEIVGIVFGVLFGVLLLAVFVLMCVKEAKGRKKARSAMPANVTNTVPVVAYATNQPVVYQHGGGAVPPTNYYLEPPPAYPAAPVTNGK